jgi:hypothetical protein
MKKPRVDVFALGVELRDLHHEAGVTGGQLKRLLELGAERVLGAEVVLGLCLSGSSSY